MEAIVSRHVRLTRCSGAPGDRKPDLTDDGVLVRVRAASLNAGDWSCPDGDDHIPLLVSSFDIPMSLGDLLQRIASIDDRS